MLMTYGWGALSVPPIFIISEGTDTSRLDSHHHENQNPLTYLALISFSYFNRVRTEMVSGKAVWSLLGLWSEKRSANYLLLTNTRVWFTPIFGD